MGQVFIEDIIVEAEKKLVKVTDAENPYHENTFLLINNQLRIKKFGYGTSEARLVGCYKDGFVVETYTYIRTSTQAYNYDFDLLASTQSSFKFNIKNNESFCQFVKKFSAEEENCK